ncbi:MAG: hypothetical protein GC162_18970 [Planctomycetes bacterium]|nr:hypothetical protein [Planctomycetota bacterium]
MSGLLPETAKQFVDLLATNSEPLLKDFPKYEIGLIHWALTCPEFIGDRPARFLPWPSGRMKPESSVFMRNAPLLKAWDRLVKLLGGQERADSLVAALSDSVIASSVKYDRVHQQLAQEIGVEEKVARCNNALGTEYEEAVLELLKEELNWSVEQVDDGKRQNVPDILLQLGKVILLIECKTVTKKPPLITKDEAFAVLQKAADYDPGIRRVTLGKPDFDEHSKKKAAASPAITLVQHHVFMEGLMRVLTGRLTAQGFIGWLAEPGVTDLSRLPGTPTYAEAAQ